MNPADALLLLASLAASLYMTGLIWTIQWAHYPLMAHVGVEQFVAYEKEHQSRMAPLVAPAMLLEGVTAALLCWRFAGELPWPALLLSLGLVLVTWLITALVSMPLHTRLAQRFDESDHRRLVRTNWGRTLAWSGRSLLMLWFVWLSISAGG